MNNNKFSEFIEQIPFFNILFWGTILGVSLMFPNLQPYFPSDSIFLIFLASITIFVMFNYDIKYVIIFNIIVMVFTIFLFANKVLIGFNTYCCNRTNAIFNYEDGYCTSTLTKETWKVKPCNLTVVMR